MPRDRRRLGRRLENAATLRDAAARGEAIGEVTAELDAAAARVEARRRAVPTVSYPPELPVSQRKDEIAAAIRDNQVIIVAGETGSGKTTQLPKICLELGRGNLVLSLADRKFRRVRDLKRGRQGGNLHGGTGNTHQDGRDSRGT